MKISLPPPNADQQAHSARLAAALRDEIRADGPMPFSRWMERCLYAPGLGYYSAGSTKFGASGDFVTAPELGRLFAQCVATSVLPVFAALNRRCCFLELGAGSGAFAEAALLELALRHCVPDEYAILEPSADLRERQRERLRAALPPELFSIITWLDRPPAQNWQGVLFANEVIDALPVTRFAIADGMVFEEHVGLDGERFVIRDVEAGEPLVAAVRALEKRLGRDFDDGYRSEIAMQLPSWISSVTETLERGIVLFVDYGHTRNDYYASDRSSGTLQCHYQHRVHADALTLPGLQDITASVDFSAVAEAAVGAGLDVLGYASQSQFLLDNGLVELHSRYVEDADASELYELSRQIKRLTLPDQMGERFQA
ncbi:MAG: SAM-dependent methyltransferase, partial [Dokdonella sp.]